MSHRELIALQIRRLTADVYGWSVAGTRETTRINFHLPGRFELGERIREDLGVEISNDAWPLIVNVGKLIEYVDRRIGWEYANAD
jgi:hypothetical protein